MKILTLVILGICGLMVLLGELLRYQGKLAVKEPKVGEEWRMVSTPKVTTKIRMVSSNYVTHSIGGEVVTTKKENFLFLFRRI